MPQLQRQRRCGRIHWRIILKTSHALQTFKMMINSMDIGLLWLHPALKKLLYYYWPVMTLSLICQFRLGGKVIRKVIYIMECSRDSVSVAHDSDSWPPLWAARLPVVSTQHHPRRVVCAAGDCIRSSWSHSNLRHILQWPICIIVS